MIASFVIVFLNYFSGRSSFILALEQQQQQQQQRINLEKTLSFFAVSIKCVEITKLMNLDKVSIKKKVNIKVVDMLKQNHSHNIKL